MWKESLLCSHMANNKIKEPLFIGHCAECLYLHHANSFGLHCEVSIYARYAELESEAARSMVSLSSDDTV